MIITQDNINWLNAFYPKLNLTRDKETFVIEGVFEFRAGYNKKNGYYKVLEADEEPNGLRIIEDSYSVTMTFGENVNHFKEVKEVGGKILQVAYEKGVRDLRDLHFDSSSNGVCLIGPLDENPDIGFEEFVDKIVLQFFYDQSHFRDYGEWPRAGFSHGILGVLENFYANHKRCKIMEEDVEKCIQVLRESEAVINNRRNWLTRQKQAIFTRGNGLSARFKFLESGAEKDMESMQRLRQYLCKKKNNKGWSCLECRGVRFMECHPGAFDGLQLLKSAMKKNRINF